MTRSLAGRGFALTAIDIGPSMIEHARRNVDDVDFEVTAFEDFDAPDGSFDLITSATAFHWVDPDVRWTKTGRLLRDRGWLVLLETGEQYDDPFGSALTDAWIARSPDGGAWAKRTRPTFAELLVGSGLFDTAIERSHTERRTMTPAQMLDVEQTRAIFLTYDAPTQAGFVDELTAALGGVDEVALEQRTTLTMAQVRPGA